MKINVNIMKKVDGFPEDLKDIAKLLIGEIEKGNRSNSQIEDVINNEIRDIILEEEL